MNAPKDGSARAVAPVVQLVVFRLGESDFGLEITRVREIGRLQPLTPMPRAPRHLEGVMNLRGRIIPVFDLKVRLGLPPTPRTEEARILVTEWGGQTAGLLVDRVREVVKVPRGAVRPAPGMVTAVAGKYLEAIAEMGDRLVFLLDLERVFRMDEREGDADGA